MPARNLERFSQLCGKRPAQAPLGRLQLSPDSREDRRSDRGLTPQQLLICQGLGLTPEAFKAQKPTSNGKSWCKSGLVGDRQPRLVRHARPKAKF